VRKINKRKGKKEKINLVVLGSRETSFFNLAVTGINEWLNVLAV